MRHLAKLQVRLHTLGYPRDFLDEVIAAAKATTVQTTTDAEAGLWDIPGLADDDEVTTGTGHDDLRRAL